MGELVPTNNQWPVNRPTDRAVARIVRDSQRALAQINQDTLIRVAQVQGEGIVQGEKLHEIDRLAHDAMAGQALLYGWETHLAGEDPVLRHELHFFSDMAKLAKGEVIADTVASLRRIR
jgi:hypothetical protein